tara:strand:+ start:835 stop:1071 length:237 start_codon:yes stop_codon:yes gene_type:complete
MPKHTPKIDMLQRIEKVDKALQKNASELNTHEEVCALRYSQIESQFQTTLGRIKRLETIVISTAATIIILLLGMVYRG